MSLLKICSLLPLALSIYSTFFSKDFLLPPFIRSECYNFQIPARVLFFMEPFRHNDLVSNWILWFPFLVYHYVFDYVHAKMYSIISGGIFICFLRYYYFLYDPWKRYLPHFLFLGNVSELVQRSSPGQYSVK